MIGAATPDELHRKEPAAPDHQHSGRDVQAMQVSVLMAYIKDLNALTPSQANLLKYLAPRAGFEPATNRLTAGLRHTPGFRASPIWCENTNLADATYSIPGIRRSVRSRYNGAQK
jgi:hypothetical protein